MAGKKITYKAGYKYQLAGRNYTEQVKIRPANPINRQFLSLDTQGLLTIHSGYAWDGTSGLTIDTKNFMRGSLVHDALYQLMRNKDLPASDREAADQELRRICREDGMTAIRAWWVFKAVRWGAADAASPKNKKPVLSAP